MLLATLEQAQVTVVFAAFGEKSLPAESGARALVGRVRRFLASRAEVDEFLVDQLMVPLALAGDRAFTLGRLAQHALTNAAIIARFLPVTFSFEPSGSCATCSVSANQGPTPAGPA